MRIAPITISIMMLASPYAWAGPQQTAAIAADTTGLAPKFASEVQDGVITEVVDGFAAAQFTLAPISDAGVITQIRECADQSCLEHVAKGQHLDLVVQIKVQVKRMAKKGKNDYDVSMIVARAIPEVDSWRERVDCPDCDSSGVDHMMSLLATSIGQQIAREAPPPPPPLAANPTPPPPATKIITKPEAEARPDWTLLRYLSAAAAGAGLVAIGSGIYALHLNGKGSCQLVPPLEACPEIHHTKPLGIGLLTGGAAAVVGGSIGVIVLGPGQKRMEVGFDGSSFSISGAF